MLTYLSIVEGKCGTVEVPDDKWVVQVDACTVNYYTEDGEPPESEFRRNQAVGPQPAVTTLQSDQWKINDARGWMTVNLLVGDEPFGVVTTDTQEGEGLYFTSAQQVHKGQLGRRMPIDRPRIVRSASPFPKGNHSQRKHRRGGWVQLDKLAKLADMPALEIVKTYFAFTDQREPQLHLVQGDVEYVQSRVWDAFSCERVKARELTPEYWQSLDLEQTWVRLGWATRVLQMHTLGYLPNRPLCLSHLDSIPSVV